MPFRGRHSHRGATTDLEALLINRVAQPATVLAQAALPRELAPVRMAVPSISQAVQLGRGLALAVLALGRTQDKTAEPSISPVARPAPVQVPVV